MTRGFFVLLAAVIAAGCGALAWATDGFRVVTSEGEHALAVARAPPAVPDVTLVDQDGKAFSFADYRGRTVLVDFIYTRCPTICSVYGDDFHRLLAHATDAPTDHTIDLLSISFDAADDNREMLKLYGDRFGATAPRWRIARPVDDHGLATLLRTFGVIVIPDGFGGFVHNSDVYVVDARGRLTRILDPEASGQFAAAIERVASQ